MPLDRVKSLKDYRTVAERYDRATRRVNGVRRCAVAALRLRRGEIVIDDLQVRIDWPGWRYVTVGVTRSAAE